MKPRRKRSSTVRIIAVTLLAVFLTIALFIIFVSGFDALIPIIPSPAVTKRNIDGAGGYQDGSNISYSSPSLRTTKVSSPNTTETLAEPRHEHASIMVFINGNLLNFSDVKFQNQDLLMHFEGGDGITVHKHAKKSWLGPFFESLNITFAQNCLSMKDNGSSYCSTFDNQISLFVNGEANNLFQHYIPKDGDKILLSYGSDKDQIDKQRGQLASIPIA